MKHKSNHRSEGKTWERVTGQKFEEVSHTQDDKAWTRQLTRKLKPEHKTHNLTVGVY